MAVLVAIAAVAVSTFLITTVYRTYSQTWDEAAHIACGMEWLQHGSYSYESLHPPLARVAVATPLFVSGARLRPQTQAGAEGDGQEEMLIQGNALLNLYYAEGAHSVR